MLFVPYALDDHLFLLASSDAAAGERRLDSEGPFDLYSIALGSSDRMQSMMDSGIYYPWWTLKSFKLNFFRPLGSAAIWLDLWLGLPAWAAHLHSLLWFA
ncbi:MAG: hypothetical protein OEZ34_05195, partial [Spirochaetia bacterium]|nr:hypothetical protein [Spirochaetia bacterium]